jgi:hypothetical protein
MVNLEPSNNYRKLLEEVRVETSARGRLIFAVDATASREHSWDTAAQIQAEMFLAAPGLQLQLVYFRGHEECKNSNWVTNGAILAKAMGQIRCAAGTTKIEKVFNHAIAETKKQPIQGLIYIGDAFEEELKTLVALAGLLGELKVPMFVFFEGNDEAAFKKFKQLTLATNGILTAFNRESIEALRKMLMTTAQFAVGSVKLEDLKRLASEQLLQLKHHQAAS